MKYNKYQLNRLEDNDIPSVVELFNRNNSYQVIKGEKVTVADFLLTCELKEISDFYVLKYEDKVIGTAAFFKYTVLGVAQSDSYVSGYLLIDSEFRTGQAIGALHKQIFYEAISNDYGTQLTEINTNNKASLALSRKNGFIVTDDSYEDIHNCISLKSPIIKILKAHKMTGNIGKKYDAETFKVLSQQFLNNNFYTEIEVSGSPMKYKITDMDKYPYVMKTNIYTIELIEKRQKMYLKYTIQKGLANKMYVKSNGRYKRTVKLPEKGEIVLGSARESYDISLRLKSDDGERKLRLTKSLTIKEKEEINQLLINDFFGMHVYFNPTNGSIGFYENQTKVFEDIFITANFKDKLRYSIKKKKNNYQIIGQNRHIKIIKNLIFSDDLQVIYTIKKIKSDLGIVTSKFGLKIEHHDYWIWNKENNKYQKYITGIYPSESDDFVTASLFSNLNKYYYIEHINKQLEVRSTLYSSNQMQMRPLFHKKIKCFNDEVSYNIRLIDEKIEHSKFATSSQCKQVKTTTNKHYQIQHVIGMPSENYGIIKKNLTEKTKHKMYVKYQSHVSYDKIKMNIEEQDTLFMNYMNYKLVAINFDLNVVGQLKMNMSNQFECWKVLENHSSKHEFYEKVELFDEQKGQHFAIEIKNGYIYISREKRMLQVRCLFKDINDPSVKINYR